MIGLEEFPTETGNGNTAMAVSSSSDVVGLHSRELPENRTSAGDGCSCSVEESKSVQLSQLSAADAVFSYSGKRPLAVTVSVGADKNVSGAASSTTTMTSAGVNCLTRVDQNALHAASRAMSSACSDKTGERQSGALSSPPDVTLASGCREKTAAAQSISRDRCSRRPLGVDGVEHTELELNRMPGVASGQTAAAMLVDDPARIKTPTADGEDTTACFHRRPQRHPFVVPLPGQELVSKDMVDKIVRQNARLKQTLRQLIETHYGITVSEYLDRLEQEDVKFLKSVTGKNVAPAVTETTICKPSTSGPKLAADSTDNDVEHVTGNSNEKPRDSGALS